MKITILTLFPQMISGFLNESIVKRAQDKKIVTIEIVNLRDFSTDSYKTVDDKPYGGGAGMVMKVEPIVKALKSSSFIVHPPAGEAGGSSSKRKVVYPSAKGKVFNQKKAQEYSKLDHLVILAGHYEGIDERVLDFIDEEVSLGDFIVTGGEIATVAITDAVVRLIPGVLRKEEATRIESFLEIEVSKLAEVIGSDEILNNLILKNVKTVQLLEYPQYTRPEEFEGKRVPDILLSGNHGTIKKWRLQKAYLETKTKRPDLLI